MAHFTSVDELEAAIGQREASEWITIDQERINRFADATDDHQWIHTDPVRAAAGPFGGTIAHGYLVLSLLPALASGRIGLEGTVMGINYGLDRVRFPHPVPVDSRVRAVSELVKVERTGAGIRVTSTVTMEIEAVDKPAAVAESISLYVLG
ncbi:MaoC family dehydratase [Arthrobacter jiangjiafuii]|uniref:MaoC family dehydratase n=1 Tax=Arthrobacter jiangjiafuii TaxID=2817475 RepID=A0A975M3D5_9MICC|nr:MaoC family dehydratase [Arthrobacter jiangjiafuii]MBP3044677.1 MaoC family dehydratase [Arthrobacter jiangjiafuii]QWC09233.1 MaoC family dehydratase [Arthrobacter jiangjiafuii]